MLFLFNILILEVWLHDRQLKVVRWIEHDRQKTALIFRREDFYVISLKITIIKYLLKKLMKFLIEYRNLKHPIPFLNTK